MLLLYFMRLVGHERCVAARGPGAGPRQPGRGSQVAHGRPGVVANVPQHLPYVIPSSFPSFLFVDWDNYIDISEFEARSGGMGLARSE